MRRRAWCSKLGGIAVFVLGVFVAGPVQAQTPPPTTARTPTVTAGLGQGLNVRSPDGLFDLTIRARVQAQASFLSEPSEGTGEAVTAAQVRRMRLLFTGGFYSPYWRYYVQLGFANSDMEADLRVPVRDAWVSWTRLRDLNVRVGQGKVPFNRQRVVSSSALAMVDRSIVQGELNLDRDVGIVLSSNDLLGLGRRLGYRLGVFGGDGRNRLATNAGLLYVGRVMVSPFGGFDEGPENDLGRDHHPRLNLGASVGYNQDTLRGRSTTGDVFTLGGFDYLHAEADVMLKWRGVVVTAEWLYRDAHDPVHTAMGTGGQAVTERARTAWGYFVQAGYAFSPHWDANVRWGDLQPIGATSSVHRARELGTSVGWYGQGHDFKLQADYFYLAGEDFSVGRHQVRLQMQLFF